MARAPRTGTAVPDSESAALRSDVTLTVASKTSPGNGLAAWAAIFRSGSRLRKVAAALEPDADVTPNAAAVRSLLAALRQLRRPCRLTIRVQSHYLQQSVGRLEHWERNGWERLQEVTGDRIPVANAELWRAVRKEIRDGGHLVGAWVPVGGYAAYESEKVGDMIHTKPVGDRVKATADDAATMEAAAETLRIAVEQATPSGPRR